MSIPSRGYDWVLDACQNRRHRAEQQLAKPVLFEAVMHLSVCSTTGTMRTNCHGTRWRKPPWEFLAAELQYVIPHDLLIRPATG